LPGGAAGNGEYPAQNLLAKWAQPFRHFSPPNPGQRHFPLYEASLLSRRTIESPFIPFLFALLFFFGKIDVFSFQVPRPQHSRLPPGGRVARLQISPEKQIARSHRGAACSRPPARPYL